jgi:hypothetical protein
MDLENLTRGLLPGHRSAGAGAVGSRGVDHRPYSQGSASVGAGKKARRWEEVGPCPNKTWKGFGGGRAVLRAQATGPRPWGWACS